jgi:hypothetical protein
MRTKLFVVAVAALFASCLVLPGCGGGSNAKTSIGITPPPVSDCAGGTSDAKHPAVPRSVLTPDSGAIPATYFGLNPHPDVFGIGSKMIPWPTSQSGFNFGAVRLWGTETTWNDMNCMTCTAPGSGVGVFDFSNLDTVLNTSIANGQTDFIYTFGVVPPWASSNPNDQSCVTNNSPAGSCDPPSDLNADGTGADAYWQGFVTALVNHAAGRIHTWEIWNEPNILIEWTGTPAQMARMAQDAYNIIKAADPSALVTTPTPGNDGSGQNINSWEPAYLSAVATLYPGNSLAPFADIVTFHGYADASKGNAPESETNNVNNLASAIKQSPFPNLANSPLWNTEGSWNNDVDANGNPLDPGTEAAYAARLYLLQWPLGIERFYWFQYGNTQNGTLTSGDGLNEAGVAYGQVYGWMVGNTMTSTGCSNPKGTIWTCDFTNNTEAVWDTSQTCSNGACTTTPYTPGSTYTKCSDLAGNTATIGSGNDVTIGARPILLEK